MSKKTHPLLIVEDDIGVQNQLKWAFEDIEVVTAGNEESALAQLRRYEPAVVTLDLGLPPDPDGASVGLATLEKIIQLAPQVKVIVVTGNNDRENAVRAIGLGAYDFYQKPIDPEILNLIVKRALHVHELEQENKRLARQSVSSPLEGIIGSSPQILKVCQSIEKLAVADVTVLLAGDSGTGKELVARALHGLSPRSSNRFVAINCAAIPETLLESELFGYEKGAFTGATKQTIGKIETANGGTLFLDEIGDLPLPMQVKLLRFLQERVIERLGGRREIPVDVRVVCATHRDLAELIKSGTFREDLYYRISEVTLRIPALREREGDVIMLARAFLENYSKQHGRKLRGFDKRALVAMEAYRWPGNVRELENKVKRAVIMAEGTTVSAEDLEFTDDHPGIEQFNLRQVRDEAERRAVQRALTYYEGNISRAAEMLGVSRPTLYDLMNKHGVKVS